jgi:DNA polymerase III epsilon subunit-like protein
MSYQPDAEEVLMSYLTHYPLSESDSDDKQVKKELEAKKKERAQARAEARKRARHSSAQVKFKDAQRYLGLRPYFDNASQQSLRQKSVDPALEAMRLSLINLPTVYFKHIVPYRFYKNARLVCVDVESWEQDHRIVTELGFAILDTNRLEHIPPGESAISWRDAIEAKHYLIQEYTHLMNNMYVQGNPDGFRYGTSEEVTLKDMSQTIRDIFDVPNRATVLVAHDAKSDIAYLQRLGFDATIDVNDTLDTQNVYYAINQPGDVQKQIGLFRLLKELGIPHRDSELHNAGNDAVLTMHALLSMLMLEATSRGTRETPSQSNDHAGTTGNEVPSLEAMIQNRNMAIKILEERTKHFVELHVTSGGTQTT